jgi:hypothetical protein
VLLSAFLLLFGLLTVLNTVREPLRIDAGAREAAFLLSNFHEPEHDGVSVFRWSTDPARIRFVEPGRAGPVILGLRIGPPPPGHEPTTVILSTERFVSFATSPQTRVYRVLLPRNLDDLDVSLATRTVRVPPDERALGIRLHEATLRTAGAAINWPTSPQWLVSIALVLIGIALVQRIGLPDWYGSVSIGAVLILIAFFYTVQPLLAHVYLTRLMIGALILLALSIWVLPALERALAWAGPPQFIRQLWNIALLAVLIRFGGSLYPLFDAYDLSLNVGRFINTLTGDLVATNRSFEFRSGVTVYPSGPYVTLLPALLIGLPQKLAVQGGIALIDGFAVIATGLLARSCGASRTTAMFAVLLHAALPISLTSLWWGHTAQIFGQALMAPLALALLVAFRQAPGQSVPSNRQFRALLIAGILFTMALLSHIGVSILAIAWLAFAWLAFGIRRSLAAPVWRRYTAMLIVAGLIGLTLVYGPAAALKLAEITKVGEAVQESRYVTHPLIARALQISYYSAGWWLILPALALTWHWRWPPGGAELIGAWIGAVLVFWAVEMVSGLQVRYMILLAPLVCIALGLLLARLATRGPAGRLVAAALTALLIAQSVIVWWQACWSGEQLLSMIPLLR